MDGHKKLVYRASQCCRGFNVVGNVEANSIHLLVLSLSLERSNRFVHGMGH